MKPIPLDEGSGLRIDRAKVLLAAISLLAAIGSLFFQLVVSWYKPAGTEAHGSPTVLPQPADPSLRRDLDRLQKQLQDLTALSQQIATPTPENKLSVQIGQLQCTVDDLRGRLQKIEAAILANPAKALEIPLLQRDLENLKSAQQSAAQSVKDGMDRLYDINKWLLGAMAVSIITLALSNLLKRPEAKDKKE